MPKEKKRLSGKFTDGTGTLDLVWFQYTKWMLEQIPINREILFFGRVQVFNHQFSMAHPEIELEDKNLLTKDFVPFIQVQKN